MPFTCLSLRISVSSAERVFGPIESILIRSIYYLSICYSVGLKNIPTPQKFPAINRIRKVYICNRYCMLMVILKQMKEHLSIHDTLGILFY